MNTDQSKKQSDFQLRQGNELFCIKNGIIKDLLGLME